MRVHVGNLPTESTLLQQVRHQELLAAGPEELSRKLNTLQASVWESHSLSWHFSKHGAQVGALTEAEYAKLATNVLSNPPVFLLRFMLTPLLRINMAWGVCCPGSVRRRSGKLLSACQGPGYLLTSVLAK